MRWPKIPAWCISPRASWTKAESHVMVLGAGTRGLHGDIWGDIRKLGSKLKLFFLEIKEIEKNAEAVI